MIFSELYSAYYNAVSKILKAAVSTPVSPGEMREIVRGQAFGESFLTVEQAFREERWQLLKRDGTTPLRHAPTMPLTSLQKSWLKAIAQDRRIRLFDEALPELPDTEPLFTEEDFSVFDAYADGDPYEDENYIRNFRMVLKAIRSRQPLDIVMKNRRGGLSHFTALPEYLEYSEKDDKFRLIASGFRFGETVNLARIVSCGPSLDLPTRKRRRRRSAPSEMLVFEVTDERNALERVLLHFAHFRKEAERIGDSRYRVTLRYDRDDETELVIRILSFGPFVKVTGPDRFTELIKDRLMRQKSCGLL